MFFHRVCASLEPSVSKTKKNKKSHIEKRCVIENFPARFSNDEKKKSGNWSLDDYKTESKS